jgi:hypothetical protein
MTTAYAFGCSLLHETSETFLPESLAVHIIALSKVPGLDIHQLAHGAIHKLRQGTFTTV